MLLALGTFIFISSFAQSNKEDVDMIQAMYGKSKKEIAADFISISNEAKSKVFWKQYDVYETERKALGQKRIALLEKYQLRYSVEWWLSGQPFLTGRGKLVDAVVNAIEHYNEIKPQLLTNGGTSDGRFIARMGAQVVELGPVNATIHKINECVNAADLQLLARMYQRVMEQLVA